MEYEDEEDSVGKLRSLVDINKFNPSFIFSYHPGKCVNRSERGKMVGKRKEAYICSSDTQENFITGRIILLLMENRREMKTDNRMIEFVASCEKIKALANRCFREQIYLIGTLSSVQGLYLLK